MNKLYGLLSCFVIALTLSSTSCASRRYHSVSSPADYVNPFIGASTSVGAAGTYHGLGKTFPGATTPYGMVQVSPNTITGGDNSPGYSYEHRSIEGFAFTQMSGVGWYGDLGNFLVMPTIGKLHTIAGKEDGTLTGYRSPYNKSSEIAQAGYYAVDLERYHIRVEATAAPHSGMLRFTFPQSKESRIQIDLARRVGGTAIQQYVRKVDDYSIQGWMRCTPEGGGWGDGDGKADYTVYFYARFDKPLKKHGIWSAEIPDDWKRKRDDVQSIPYQSRVAGAKVWPGKNEMEGKHLGVFSEFETSQDEQVNLQVGISFVDMQGAENNFKKEIAGKNFDRVRQEAKEMWNTQLSKIALKGGTEDQKTIFYTSLYHTMIDPRVFTDVDRRYTGGDNRIHRSEGFTKRTIFSGWDVFRSQFPLQTLINPSLVNDELNSLISLADESGKGYFERWELLNAYSGCMIGNPALSVLADAYVKGIRNYDLSKALTYAINTSKRFGNDSLGYTPGALSISNTLEYAYTDWCIAQLAKGLNKRDTEQVYLAKSQAYRKIFDLEKGWFRPRKSDGSWEEWPENARTKEWYGTIESNPYQQGWFVPHDIPGMIELMGGKEKTLADLTDFFEKTPENMLWNDYYNHANEPVHLVPFLFNHLEAPYLTQKWTRYICDNAYSNTVEGIVGNEDVGQMSAWYVLAASGIHPSCPGSTRFEITSPIFQELSFQLDPNYFSGKRFRIVAHDNSADNIYIQRAVLNGKPYAKNYIDFKDMVAGATLELYMGPNPNKDWGIK
ncbi:glycoside hydrolase family 92 protein [Sphingobacterium sp. N143]|uniref:GH92 family glycosyl hydrolase n=1 Tax=Sphingobacterium sp. N143 TaxID=2746727 RepID=UPI002576CA67|nr:GH92 family glycosyl hydrolase [Sphingobacterium sp. N143]MDM1295250.1 glycoside hydrolase family 92 protein [Sphingobacterium sp. N143]